LASTSASSAPNTFIFGADFEDGTIGGLTANTIGSAVVNVPAVQSQYMYGLKVDGWVKQPNPVLPKRPGKWDDYGTREIAPIISESDGKVEVGTDGKITAYYMGISSTTGYPAAIGIAKSSDGGYTWIDRLDTPVIGPSGVPDSWYQWSVQQPSVLRRSSDDLLMIMAAGWSTNAYTSGSMGVFTSTDGVNWTDQGQKLTISQFHFDGSNGINQIGMPSVIKRSVSGDYLLLFSGCKTGSSIWRIFAATSLDFTGTWAPLNGGYPVFQETGTGWEQGGVATPHVVEMSPNQFVMAYSGTGVSNWRVGFASTSDFITWTRYGNNPVLQPSFSWDVNLIQASFLVKTEIGSTGLLYFQGFDASGSPQVGLATNIPGEAGRVLHGYSASNTDGWVVGTNLDPTATFIWEFLTQTPNAPSTVNPGLDIGLMNWATVPSPTDNGTWHLHDGINIQRLAGNASSNPGKFQIMYKSAGGTTYSWTGSIWSTSLTWWFGGFGQYKVRIWDDGTNYKVDLINTSTGLSVLPNVASIAKTSVRPFNLGRVIEVSEPFTNYYAIDANLDNWIVRKYVANEPSTSLGGVQFLSCEWIGAVNTDWSNPANWTAGAPLSFSLVTIPSLPSNQPHITASVASPSQCDDLTIENGAALTIDAGKALTINGTLTNNAGETGLRIKSDVSGTGSLISSTTGIDAKVERFLTKMKWHFIGMPVESGVAGVFQLPSGHSDIYLKTHIEETNSWGEYIIPVSTSLELGRGYECWVGDDTYNSDEIIVFPGKLNAGDFVTNNVGGFYDLTFNGSGYNFICNPYPSALQGNINSWARTNVDASIWVWEGTGTTMAGGGNYLTWNGTTGSLTDGIIPSMQGFFVHANNTGPSLTIPQSSRVHHSQLFYKDSGLPLNTLRVDVEGNGCNDALFVCFNEQSTEGYDPDFDVRKLYGTNLAPQLYAIIPGDELSINVLPALSVNRIVDMGFECEVPATFTIKVTGFDGFNEDTDFYLEDLKVDIVQDLKENPVYTFTGEFGDDPNRFLLHFGNPNGIHDVNSNPVRIYSNNDQIYILNPTYKQASVIIYDVTGRQIVQRNIYGETTASINIKTGTGLYIVKLKTDDRFLTQKVIIK
jgi:hypothetical protein